MLELEAGSFSLATHDRVVLHAYHCAEQALPAERPRQACPEGEEIERARWVARIGEVDGVPRDRLAPIHGRLIAHGYLQFQLQGRDAGVVYRVTSEGRAALEAACETTVSAPLRRSA